ncbi:MAG: hypothetical protein ACRDYY_00950 [Acidimicrobiales bacterium]
MDTRLASRGCERLRDRGTLIEGDDVEEMVRAKAAEQRQAGLVPEDLEERLDAHARAVLARPAPPGDRLRHAAESIPVSGWRLQRPRSMRDLMGLLREVAAATRRVEELAESTRAALLVAAETLDHPGQHTHPELAGPLDQALDRLSGLDRLPGGGLALADLRQRVEALEAARRAAGAVGVPQGPPTGL